MSWCKVPNVSVEKKVKNVARNSMGDKVGKLHMKRQNLDRLQSKTRRVTALRDGKREPGRGRKLRHGNTKEGLGELSLHTQSDLLC